MHGDSWINEEYDKLVERECFSNSIYNSIVMPIYLASEMGYNSKLFFFDVDFDKSYCNRTFDVDERYEETLDVLKMENAIVALDELIKYFHKKYSGSKKPVYLNKSIEACENKIYAFNGYSDNDKWREMLFVFKELIFNGYTIAQVEGEEYVTEHSCEYCWGNLSELNWVYEDSSCGVREHRDMLPDKGIRICFRISWDKNARDIPKITGW